MRCVLCVLDGKQALTSISNVAGNSLVMWLFGWMVGIGWLMDIRHKLICCSAVAVTDWVVCTLHAPCINTGDVIKLWKLMIRNFALFTPKLYLDLTRFPPSLPFHFPSFFFSPFFSVPPFKSRIHIFYPQGLGSAINSPARSGTGPQPKQKLVGLHYTFKIWDLCEWQQFVIIFISP